VRQASWAALALLLGMSQAHAQLAAANDSIRLELDDCDDVSGTTVRELVVLEVAPRSVLAYGSAEPAATRAELTCEAGIAAIVVEEAGRSSALRLEVTLSDLARSARPRGLALAVAELIATSRLQPTAAGVEPVQEIEADSYEAPVLSEPTRSGVQLWLGVGAARMAQPNMLGPVGALGVVGYWGAFALTSDLRFEHAQMSQGVAELQLNAGSLALAPAWRLHASSADLLVGAGVRAGFATLSGKSNDPTLAADSVTGFWLAPAVQVAVHVRLARRWALRVGVEGAYVTQTLRGLGADGEVALELKGLSLAAVVGISWGPSSAE
jgi:hypothetical protein